MDVGLRAELREGKGIIRLRQRWGEKAKERERKGEKEQRIKLHAISGGVGREEGGRRCFKNMGLEKSLGRERPHFSHLSLYYVFVLMGLSLA